MVGDTVGDPYKDTSSVALNPIIKFTTLFGLLAVEMAVANPGDRARASRRVHAGRAVLRLPLVLRHAHRRRLRLALNRLEGGPLPATERDFLIVPPGYHSREVASFVAQLDDQSRLLRADLEGVLPEELSWQPAPGMNTIGMLLAHIAIVEVFWCQIAIRGITPPEYVRVLGIDRDDDGIPLPDGAPPPAVLDGKELPSYFALLDRARAYAKETAMPLTDADLDPQRERTRRDGVRQEYNVRWVLYHLCEHFSGHYGQILLLRHQYRARPRKEPEIP